MSVMWPPPRYGVARAWRYPRAARDPRASCLRGTEWRALRAELSGRGPSLVEGRNHRYPRRGGRSYEDYARPPLRRAQSVEQLTCATYCRQSAIYSTVSRDCVRLFASMAILSISCYFSHDGRLRHSCGSPPRAVGEERALRSRRRPSRWIAGSERARGAGRAHTVS